MLRGVVAGVTVGALLMAGCARSAKNIEPAYVSPVLYESYNCQQIGEEAQRVSARAAVLTGVTNKKATGDAVAMGVGIVLFWPALFFIKGNSEQAAELAQIKGQMTAIEQASIRKQCGLEFQKTQPPPAAPQSKPVAVVPKAPPAQAKTASGDIGPMY